MRTVYIEDNTPEGQWLLDLIKDHKSVTVAPKVIQEKKNASSWDRAIATGAMSLEEFGMKFTEAIHQAYK
ncbi:MAG: hypothetical protein LUC96_07315 [Alistipes sp.]|uniref:hypothetical protein n=1 Tax=Alistipes sp. TaxID=1872444 RepID=UPI0025BAAD89|nr:hypothetical protein [Alistipes sp.]MCD8274777.1 hypothetical protein [Alistipes sp.]